MIYTLTLNPSLDYYISITDGISNEVPNRISSSVFTAGGKGINVSKTLLSLGMESIAVAPIGGALGEYYKTLVEKTKINCRFINANTETRVNVKAKSGADTYEFNARGGELSEHTVRALIDAFSVVKDGDTVIISGSAPAYKENLYGMITSYLTKKGAKVVADTTGENLIQAVKNGAFLVKPNEDEIKALFGDDVIPSALKLCDMGAELVCVSMGNKGAYLIGKDVRLFCKTPRGVTVKNTVGAGDSLLAGFIYAYESGKDLKECLKSGVASGSCSVSTPPGGVYDITLYKSFYEGLTADEVGL